MTLSPLDLVIVDEAHRVRNPRTASGRLARSLRTRYLLLLSANPVENRLEDLFELVDDQDHVFLEALPDDGVALAGSLLEPPPIEGENVPPPPTPSNEPGFPDSP